MADEKLTTRAQDFSAWYNELVERAQLAEHSPVRGCMVIRPNGYGIWELIQQNLDKMFKETGHENAYFPLLIPESFLKKEAAHVEGFAPELAVVTHGGGKELEEPLVIRPTSETMIYTMFAKWVQGYRDLPILMNQWANVMRWEMRTRLFLRTTEFLWQEGHTAHETEAEAEEETLKMLGVYRSFAEDFMATPVITGRKTDSERFAGALRTYCIEAMMQDNKALQAGTSHNLGQNFSKVFNLEFQGRDGSMQYAWNTSWGVSTRLIGSLIMVHSDDTGLVLPPRLAPTVAVIVPIYKTDEEKSIVLETADRLFKDLKSKGFRVKMDTRDNMSPGAKYYEWELKGVPMRIEIGPKDVANSTVVIAPRITLDTREEPKPGKKQKLFIAMDALCDAVEDIAGEIQSQLLKNATARRESNSIRGITDYEQMKEILSRDGGFVYAGWNGDPASEAKVKEETRATIRCIPDAEFRSTTAPTKCIVTGEAAKYEVIWSKAY